MNPADGTFWTTEALWQRKCATSLKCLLRPSIKRWFCACEADNCGLSNTCEWKKMENTGITFLFFFSLTSDPVWLENKISHWFCFQINIDKILSLAVCDACVEEIGYSAPHDCGPVPFLIFATTPWLLEVYHKGWWFNSSCFIGGDVPCFCRRIDLWS